jgi:hypothetical protein
MNKKTINNISDSRIQKVTATVVIQGFRDIMFDRYAGDNDTKLTWKEKIYLIPGTNILALPVENVYSFFTATNTQSAPKRLRDARTYKKICNALQSFLEIVPTGENLHYIPFMRDNKVIEVGNFDVIDRDTKSGIYLHRTVARLDKGIPNPKERPVLPSGWQLAFEIQLYQNEQVKMVEIKNLLEQGGIALGFGTYRGVFGKFSVEKFEV